MAIDLRTYASGDTDYIAKMNANVAAITAAIEALQAQAGAAGAGTALSAGTFMSAIFNNADALIGPGSYKPTLSGVVATIAPGGMYLIGAQTAVAKYTQTTLTFTGQSAGTKFIVIDGAGNPSIQDASGMGGTAYSVVWTGTGFSGVPTRIAPAFYDTTEATGSRDSASLAAKYETLDGRLEAGENKSQLALDTAEEALDTAEEAKTMLANAVASSMQKFRKVGVTVDDTTGIKGLVQLDFEGVIVGWSIIANTAGAITVEVSKKASSPPPAAPAIPHITTDKISASAPIALAGTQSAASGEAGVSTWTLDVNPWDVMQFNVTAITTITRATLYVRIMEQFPESFITLPTIVPMTEVNAPPNIVQF